jgi:hypothetical protein
MKAHLVTGLLYASLVTAIPAAAQALLDPMRPATAAPEGDPVVRSSGPVLEQIVLGEGRKFAVISGRKVSVGDRVGDATVTGIGPDQVTLKGGTSKVLTMFPRAGRKSTGELPVPQARKAEEGS